jgi:hypothetical protein
MDSVSGLLMLSPLLVPPGKISQNTLDFLKQLAKPECNDREWWASFLPIPSCNLDGIVRHSLGSGCKVCNQFYAV